MVLSVAVVAVGAPGVVHGDVRVDEPFPGLDDLSVDAAFTASALGETSARAWASLEGEVARLWGPGVDPDPHRWSLFDASGWRHGEVDLERGELTVEVLVPGLVDRPSPGAVAAIATQLTAMMSQPTGNTEPRFLDGLVDGGGGRPLHADEAASAVRVRIARDDFTIRTVTGADGRRRTAVGVRFPLVPGHLRGSADPYLGIVGEMASRFGVDPALVLAVIHTESCFNPFARSPANAHGLMQLVPAKGARDAWQWTRGTPRVVHWRELHDPRLNVELGTAYLRILLDEFAGLRDPAGSVVAAVAAYNCGPGCVRRALSGGGALAPVPIALAGQRFRRLLLERVPAETRDYVDRVLERRRLWAEGSRP